ncbi:nucleotidyltransferase domain-containing protein [Flavonifractor plautii]|nr:nucleotidyltransferase domain-containing protein [Flavonifractor plautii]
MSKIYTVPELQSVLSPIFRANGVRKATLFGSYAKGVATASSDVDLLVDSGLRGLAFFGLLEQVTEALDTPVDLIDVSQVETGSEIAREIQKVGWHSLSSKDQLVLKRSSSTSSPFCAIARVSAIFSSSRATLCWWRRRYLI